MGTESPDFVGVDPDKLQAMTRDLALKAGTAQSLLSRYRPLLARFGIDTSALNAIGQHLSWALDQVPMLDRVEQLARQMANEAGIKLGSSGAPMIQLAANRVSLGRTGPVGREGHIPPDGDGVDPNDPDQVANGLLRAEQVGDHDAVKQLLDDIKGHENDPSYTSKLFKDLGPGYTIKIAEELRDYTSDDSDARRLETYDTALGTATSSPGWDNSFNQQIWAKSDPAQPYPDGNFLLLQDGVYSENFLTTAGDAVLFTYRTAATGGADPYAGEHESDVLDALARNKNAAFDYLTGAPPGAPGDSESRLTRLLGAHYAMSEYPYLGTSLGNAIASAGTSDYAGDPHRADTLFQDIAAADSRTIPDGARGGIATAISAHIDQFSATRPSADGSINWQQKLFLDAEVDSNGNVLWDNVQQVQAAVGNWSKENMPASETDKTAFTAWSQQVGTLWGLTAYPIRESKYRSAAEDQEIDSIFGFLFNYAPGGGTVNNVANILFQNRWGTTSALDAENAATQQYWTQIAFMRRTMAQQYLQQHPDLQKDVPGGTLSDKATWLAEQNISNPDQPDGIQNFIDTMKANADDTFGQQYELTDVNGGQT